MRPNFRGIVEGFFSRPLPTWNWQERNVILDQIIQSKTLNTYVYCPKDDFYVTTNWCELYPAIEFENFRKFTDTCRENSIETFYGLNPSLDKSVYTDDELDIIVSNIMRKLLQMKEAGFQNCLILFDDIPFAYNALQGIESNEAVDYARTQAEIVNRLYNDCVTMFDNFWFCGSEYFFTRENDYLTALLDYLLPEIPLIWTGSHVFTKNIDLDLARLAKKTVRDRKIIYWTNTPVNDDPVAIGRYNLQGFNGVEPATLELLEGIIINPMREALANQPFITSFAEFCRSPVSYSEPKALEEALKDLLPATSNDDIAFIAELSNYNAFCDSPRFFYDYLKAGRKLPQPSQIIIDSNHLYLKTIKSSINDGLCFIREFNKGIISSKAIGDLIKAVSLPVLCNPVYFDSVLLLMLRRLALFYRGDDRPISDALDLYQKYKGQNKKTLPDADKQKIEKKLNALADFENKRLKEYLLSDLDITDKFFMLSKIRNITQYKALPEEKNYFTK